MRPTRAEFIAAINTQWPAVQVVEKDRGVIITGHDAALHKIEAATREQDLDVYPYPSELRVFGFRRVAKDERPPLTMYELELFAYHVGLLYTDTGKFGLSCRDGVHVEVVIEPVNPDSGFTDHIWDSVTMDGRSVGNRHGAAKAYARLVFGDPEWWRAR